MADQNVKIVIKADNSDFKRKMKDSGNVAQEESRKMQTALNGIGKAAAAVGAIVGVALVKGFKDLAEAERSLYRLEAVLRATGNAAGLTAGQIQEMAERIEGTTFFSAEQVQDAASVLATFKSITGDTFKDTLNIVTDMAEVFGTDLKSAAVQVGKALEDPINGLTALRRVGVSFNDEQKAMIENMVAVGDIASAQAEILKVLQDQLGGAAQGANMGLSGAFDNATDAVGNFLENLAGVGSELTGLQQFVEEFTIGVNYLTDALNGIPGRMEWVAKSNALGFVTEASMAPKKPVFTPPSRSGGSSGGSKQTKEYNEALRQQKMILDAIKTPQQEYADKLSVAESLLAQKLITMEEFNLYQEKLAEGFDDVGDAAVINAKLIQDKFGDALEEAAFSFESFGDSARSVLEGLARDLARQNIIDPFTAAVTGGLQSSGIFSGIGDFFGGFFANGGNPPVGKMSVVGERGPEIFVPKTAGTIIPNHALGGNGGNVTVNVVNNSSAQVGVAQTRTASGVTIEMQIDELTAKNIMMQGTRTNTAINAVAGRTLTRR